MSLDIQLCPSYFSCSVFPFIFCISELSNRSKFLMWKILFYKREFATQILWKFWGESRSRYVCDLRAQQSHSDYMFTVFAEIWNDFSGHRQAILTKFLQGLRKSGVISQGTGKPFWLHFYGVSGNLEWFLRAQEGILTAFLRCLRRSGVISQGTGK